MFLRDHYCGRRLWPRHATTVRTGAPLCTLQLFSITSLLPLLPATGGRHLFLGSFSRPSSSLDLLHRVSSGFRNGKRESFSPALFTYLRTTLIQPFSRSQGAKAQQKRERNAAKAGGTAKSQIKTNQAAMNIVCQTCKQAFVRPFSLRPLCILAPHTSSRC